MYSIFKNEIDSGIQSKYKLYLEEYKTKYNLTDEQVKTISGLIFQQAKQSQLTGYLYPDNSQQSEGYKKNTADKYKNQILISLTMQGVETILSSYCTALSYKKQLNLKPNQIKDLVMAGWNNYQDSKTNQDFIQIRKKEHLKVKEILTKNQYEIFLSCKVGEKANQQTLKAWSEMKQLQIAAELDSTLTQQQLVPYFTERLKIQERYSIIPDSQKEMDTQLAALKANRPNVMKKCDAEKKRVQKSTEQNINALKW